VADGSGVDDGHVAAATGEAVGGGDADDAGADHKYFRLAVQGGLLFWKYLVCRGGIVFDSGEEINIDVVAVFSRQIGGAMAGRCKFQMPRFDEVEW